MIERLRFRYRTLRIGMRLWARNWRARGARDTPTTGGHGVRPTTPVKPYPPPPLPRKEGR